MYNTHEFIHGFVGALKFASMKKMIPLIWALLLSFMATGQKVPTGLEEILHALRSLQKETRVLYLAAHPDDENTRLISWLTHGAGVETAYLSLTRGSGGQNLIGAELGAPLGYIRTQELLEARKIDGGRQFFTRAVDFGYSKNPEETFSFWGKEEVLSDVVRVIREFRPHIIITRFPTDGRGGHGHHTASALLAAEAFDLAGSLSAFPHEYGIPWSPEMLYWNASSWWDKTLPDRAAKEDGIIEVEVGGFDPINGRSCNELASMSRSMHKSQGFGVSMARGEMKEYLIHQKGANAFYERLFGEVPGKANNGARQAAELLAAGDRSGAIKKLLDLKEEGNNSPAFDRRVDGIVAGLLGLHAEALVQNGSAAVGQQLDVELRCIKRMDIPLMIREIDWNGRIQDQSEELQRDQMLIINDRIRCGALNGPYWLDRPFSTLHNVPDSLIGRPMAKADPYVVLTFDHLGRQFSLRLAVEYKEVDRVDGELKRPLVVAPPLTVRFTSPSLVTMGSAVDAVVQIRSWSDSVSDELGFDVPSGWTVTPSSIPFELAQAGDFQNIPIRIVPPKNTRTGVLRPSLQSSPDMVRSSMSIDHPHIVPTELFLPSELKLANASIDIDAAKVGYIVGAGDAVPEAIERMGFEIEFIDEERVRRGGLEEYMAIIAGIRAYNVNDWLPGVQSFLMDYVEDGGNYIVQYNTRSRDLKLTSFGPYPMKLSRERVSDETAAATLIDPSHGVFRSPNRITEADFDGWVQERGLYFADISSLDPRYETLISWQDKDEPPRLGGLIVAKHGEGAFMYTGISFFRQLPAAVPGAYRLLANLICYEP